LHVGQKARNDLFLKSLGILFQSLGPVYCIDLRVKDLIEVVVRLLLVDVLVG